jgi:L-glutamine-phosphate cytidylyltransferase
MKALIPNSGIGSRMGILTENKPKCLIRVGDETILGRQLRILSNVGITSFVITTGPFAEQIKQFCQQQFPQLQFTFVHNEKYATTNYIYSLWLAREYIDEDMLYMHGDMIFEEKHIKHLLATPAMNAVLMNNTQELWEKDGKGRIIEGKVREISIHLFDAECHNLNQVYKISKELSGKWWIQMGKYIAEGKVNAKSDDALNMLLAEGEELYPAFHQSNSIMELDTPEDIEKWNEREKN